MAKSKSPKSRLASLNRRLKDIKAKDIMTEYVITTTENTTLAEVAEIMIKTRISGLPVVNKRGRIIGIITATDLFIVMDMIKSGEIITSGTSATNVPTAKFAMSTEIFRIRKHTSLEEIIALMQFKNAHTLPVMEGNKMVGVVGRRDVFKNFYAIEKELYL